MFDRICEKIEELNSISEFGGYCVTLGGCLVGIGLGYGVIGTAVIGVKKLIEKRK